MTSNVPGDHLGVQIGVIGPGAADATAVQCEIAREVGDLLARAGAHVICGGLGGVMEGVARGVYEAGGFSIGVIPGRDRGAASRYLSVVVCAGIGEKRNEIVVDSSDAIVVIGRNEGTVIEVLLARKYNIAVFGVDWSPVVAGAERLDDVAVVVDPAEAVARAVEVARARVLAGMNAVS